MTLKRLFILIILASVICSFSIVSAADSNSTDSNLNGESNIIQSSVEENLEDLTDEPIENIIASTSNEDICSSNDYTIYVGTNSTPDGQGTDEDPYATLDLARNAANTGDYKSKVTVNINEGTYYLGSYLKFNTNNLIINGNGLVIIKSLHNNTLQAFGCDGNFTMNNIIFNASDFTAVQPLSLHCFTPFYGKYVNANVILNNCTFADYDGDRILPADGGDDFMHNTNLTFNYCKFISSKNKNFDQIGSFDTYEPTHSEIARFNYCIFSAGFNTIGFYNNPFTSIDQTIIFDSCWLGHNNGYTTTFYEMTKEDFPLKPCNIIGTVIFDRHAVLTVSENYLGDNKYEIIGKLMWNDSTDDNIDKLDSMIIHLSANNGDIPECVMLKNGMFNVTYTAVSPTHEINVTLDQQKIILSNDFIFSSEAINITYGDNQNITVTFPNKVNGTIHVVVDNNQTYDKPIDDQNSIAIPINTQELIKGVHDVKLTFDNKKMIYPYDNITHLYSEVEMDIFGFNSTTITVNGKSDYIFNVSQIDNVFVGDEKTLTITLPDDANGTITVYVNNKKFNTTVRGNTTTITINGFVAGNNVVNITYEDNNKYESKNITKNVEASVKPTTIATVNVTTTYNVAKELVITLTDVNGKVLANKTINVVVGTINKNLTTNVSGQVSVDVSTLAPNAYVANIAFAGDELYAKSNATANVVVNKVASLVTAPNVTTTYNVAKNLVIILTDINGEFLVNKTINVVIGNINENLTTNVSGQVSVDVSTLAPNAYVANIAFAGDELYAKSNATANVVVNKVATSLSTPAVTATYNVAKNLVITLTANGKALEGQKVTVKVGTISKTLTTNAKGQVSVDVSKLTPKTYTATITYAGDTINAKSTGTAKVVVNKAKSKLTAKKATFKAKKKTKKYSVVLKDNKGKAIKKAKVTLKVKGKTYKATTNAKGKATFKITKLNKKGKATATIKFGGNTLYKAATKKIKLTVKK